MKLDKYYHLYSRKLDVIFEEIPNPVRHGKWKLIGDDTFAGEYACSNCNRKAEVDLYGQWILSNYCSNCGTKMEELE